MKIYENHKGDAPPPRTCPNFKAHSTIEQKNFLPNNSDLDLISFEPQVISGEL